MYSINKVIQRLTGLSMAEMSFKIQKTFHCFIEKTLLQVEKNHTTQKQHNANLCKKKENLKMDKTGL